MEEAVMKIGLSLSFCVKDLMSGEVLPDEVQFIIAGTSIESDEEFKKACESYASSYWIKNPNEGKFHAKWLWEEKKIHQPKLDSEDGMTMPAWHRELIGQGVHWLTVEPRKK
jgi:hypothetical protein